MINVPADWNGRLVMFAHGYEGEGSGRGAVRSEPLADSGRFCFRLSPRPQPHRGNMKALNPAELTQTGKPLRLLRLAVPAFRPQPRKLPAGRFVRRLSASGCFQASPRMSRLATALRRIRFVILRTAGSPPVAPHPASRRRSYLRLRSQRPAPTRTCTVLTKRPHGAHSYPRKRAPRANAPNIALDSRLRGNDEIA